MSITPLLILHLAGIFTLLGVTFYAFAAPLETKKTVMMVSGIAALDVLLTGGAMLGIEKLGMPGWAWVKLGCWLVLAGIGGMAYKKRDKAVTLMVVVLAVAVLAASMVLTRPF